MDSYLENFEKVKRLMLGFTAFKTLATACDFNLFQLLLNKPGLTREEIAKELGLADHALRVLLLGCCTYELLKRNEGRYFNTELADQFLTEKSTFPILPFTRYCDVVQYPAFQYLQ